MCLSPIPWMLCSPKPFRSIVGHSAASTATINDPSRSFSQSPAPIVPGRAGRGDEGAQPQPRLLLAQRLEDALERGAGREVVDDVVPELGELVQDHVLRVLGQLVAPVVDLLHVALGARRPDDVARGRDPLLEPGEALAAHALGEDGDAVAAEQARDGDAAAAVVAGRRPDRRGDGVGSNVPVNEPRHQAAVRGEHLVGADQREAVAEHDDDSRLDARQLGGQDEVLGDVDEARPVGAVVPVHPEQVQRMGVVGPDGRERRGGRRRGSSGGCASCVRVGSAIRASLRCAALRSRVSGSA